MFRWLSILLAIWSLMAQALAADAAGFHKRFQVVKSAEGKALAIRLKAINARFTLKPFIEQIKQDLLAEQRRWSSKSALEMEAAVDAQLAGMGLDPYAKGDDAESIAAIKESLMNLPNINVEESFREVVAQGLMGEFESRMSDALLQLDLSLVANLEDPRFFYRRNVVYAVVAWALEEAQKRFSSVPLLNLATFVVVKVHDLLIEQKTFHHNMLLEYLNTVPESELGMTKLEVDRAVSSIFEYRIDVMNLPESNRAAQEWDRYGWNNFYIDVRLANTRQRGLGENSQRYSAPKRLNYAFAEFTVNGQRQILNLFHNQFMFSSKPAVAYDFANPGAVKRNRALMNLGQVGLGFLPIPGWLKNMANTFIDSMHVEQRRLEGALVPYFESVGQADMVQAVYQQNINPYIVRP